MTTRSYIGSKNGNGVWQQIISAMPPHEVYVEPFLGSGVILRKKKPANFSIAIDIDRAAPGLSMVHGADHTNIVGDALEQLSSLKPQIDDRWLIYCDPPYLRSTRSHQLNYFRHEFADETQHRDLLSLLVTLPALVMISGYQNDLYDDVLHGWRKLLIPTVKRNGERSTEVVWMNFQEPITFHDTRYLGKNFRERERLKRKKQRWLHRLSTMNTLDKAVLLDAINDMIKDLHSSSTPCTNPE